MVQLILISLTSVKTEHTSKKLYEEMRRKTSI